MSVCYYSLFLSMLRNGDPTDAAGVTIIRSTITHTIIKILQNLTQHEQHHYEQPHKPQ